jgi:transposase
MGQFWWIWRNAVRSTCFPIARRKRSPPGYGPIRKSRSSVATAEESTPLLPRRVLRKREPLADKFHLVKNLREGLQELMARKQKVLPEVEEVASNGVRLHAQGKPHESACSALSPSEQPEHHWRVMSKEPRQTAAGQMAVPSASEVSRTNRVARYEAVRALHQQALSERAIARRLKLSRNTVHRFLTAESFPERRQRSYRGSLLDPYKPSLLDRWKAGCWNGSQLYAEVKGLGYTGSQGLFRQFISSLRKHHQAAGTATTLALDAAGAKVESPADPPAQPSPKRRLSPSRASWLYVSRASTLDEKQRGQIERIRAAHADLETAYQLTQTFVTMLAEQRETGLDDWLTQADHCGIKELKSFAQGIRRDDAAVRAAFTSEWSNGPVEAQVNCLKLQKRLMFGRANFDLLRLHVLRRT